MQAAASGTEAEPQGQLQSLLLKLVKAEVGRNIAQAQAAEVHQLRAEQERITSELEAAVAQHQRKESVLAGQIDRLEQHLSVRGSPFAPKRILALGALSIVGSFWGLFGRSFPPITRTLV